MSWTAKHQAFPEAVKIVSDIMGSFPEPFNGLNDSFWGNLMESKNAGKFSRFLEIMTTDFPSFCALMFRIAPRGQGEKPFLFNRPQRMLYNQMALMLQESRPLFIIILKARQLGMSTICAAWVFWHCWKKQHTRCLTVAHEKPLAEHIIS